MLKASNACTIIKSLWRYNSKKNMRRNVTVHIRKVQKAMRSYLRDIHLIKKKNAVKVIEREWIKRCEQYFMWKRRAPIMAIQKYVKRSVKKK